MPDETTIPAGAEAGAPEPGESESGAGPSEEITQALEGAIVHHFRMASQPAHDFRM